MVTENKEAKRMSCLQKQKMETTKVNDQPTWVEEILKINEEKESEKIPSSLQHEKNKTDI